MPFIQTIEFRTSRIDEFDVAIQAWLAKSASWRSTTRSVRTKDRDRPNTYVQIVEFPSYEAAMENSSHPETAELADQLAKLSDSTPTFRNLDVIREELL
jgi:hypothetical protein